MKSIVSRRAASFALVGVVAGATIIGLGSRPVGAETTYSAAAAADAMRFSVTAPNVTVAETPIDFGAPVAQSVLDSLGTSRSFASHPYPGELVVGAPGLAAGFSNGQVNLPGYPWYASADHPSVPESGVEQGGLYSLKAKAEEHRSSAQAQSGSGSDSASGFFASAVATTAVQDDVVTASATNELRGLSAGPLDIGKVAATSSTTRNAAGAIEKNSDLLIAGMSVNGTGVVLTSKGWALGGEGTPVPSNASLQEVLAQAGISMEYLAPTESPTGVISAGLQIVFNRDFGGPKLVRLTIGRAATSIDGVGESASGISTPVDQTASPPAANVHDSGNEFTVVPPVDSAGLDSVASDAGAFDSAVSQPTGEPLGSSEVPDSIDEVGAADSGGGLGSSEVAQPASSIGLSAVGPAAGVTSSFDTTGWYGLLAVGLMAALGLMVGFSVRSRLGTGGK